MIKSGYSTTKAYGLLHYTSSINRLLCNKYFTIGSLDIVGFCHKWTKLKTTQKGESKYWEF